MRLACYLSIVCLFVTIMFLNNYFTLRVVRLFGVGFIVSRGSVIIIGLLVRKMG